MSLMTTDQNSRSADWTYVVDKDIVDRAEATLACQTVLDVLRPRLTSVRIDAYSDYRDELPPEVAQAQQWLRDVGRARGHGDPGMGIELHLPLFAEAAPDDAQRESAEGCPIVIDHPVLNRLTPNYKASAPL